MAEDESAVLLRQYIQQSLVSKATSGSTQHYDQLVQEMRKLRQAVRPQSAAAAAGAAAKDGGAAAAAAAAAPQQLVLLLRGMGKCVSYVHERKHELLLTQVLDVPLWQVPRGVRAAALELLTHLVVANGALVQSCLQTLVYSLLPPPGPPQPDALAGRAWQPSEEEAAIQDEVLAATEKVLRLVPTSASRILPLLVGNMPHKLRDRGTHCLYLRGLFALAESSAGGPIKEGVLVGVLDHLIAIDVEIRWEDIVDVQTEEAKEEEGGLPKEEEPDIFELEGMTELELNGISLEDDQADARAAMRGGWEGGRAKPSNGAAAAVGAAADGGSGDSAPAAAAPVNEVADKLDSLMELTFAHLQRRVAAGDLRQAWETMLASFERSVLNVHRSKFAQFLLFYLARTSPDNCPRAFLDLLLSRLADRHQPAITRSACAAYAASFLARAAYVPEGLVVSSLQRLADWCLKYERDEDRRGGLPPIPSSGSMAMLSGDAHVRHAAFYASCQALLYVLCYHMEPLLRQRPSSRANAAAGGQQQQQALQQGKGGAEQPPSGGTPGSADGTAGGSGSLRHPHHGHHHEQQREACVAAVRELFEAMPRLLAHRLDPLGSCARSVVAEFGRQARQLGFQELYKLIREWERQQAAGTKRQSRPLEMFFPFDPYLLSRSSAILDLQSTFVWWQRGHPSGAVRADLESDASSSSGSDSDSDSMEEDGPLGEAAADGRVKLSGGDSGSSGLDDSDSSSSSSDGEGSDGEDSDSSLDDLKRTRFGSIQGSSFGSDRRPAKKRSLRLPPALRASMMHPGSGSPTQGFLVGSTSPLGSSPYSGDGMSNGSPFGGGPFGVPRLPMGRGK